MRNYFEAAEFQDEIIRESQDELFDCKFEEGMSFCEKNAPIHVNNGFSDVGAGKLLLQNNKGAANPSDFQK
jgi:hypothetical protein